MLHLVLSEIITTTTNNNNNNNKRISECEKHYLQFGKSIFQALESILLYASDENKLRLTKK